MPSLPSKLSVRNRWSLHQECYKIKCPLYWYDHPPRFVCTRLVAPWVRGNAPHTPRGVLWGSIWWAIHTCFGMYWCIRCSGFSGLFDWHHTSPYLDRACNSPLNQWKHLQRTEHIRGERWPQTDSLRDKYWWSSLAGIQFSPNQLNSCSSLLPSQPHSTLVLRDVTTPTCTTTSACWRLARWASTVLTRKPPPSPTWVRQSYAPPPDQWGCSCATSTTTRRCSSCSTKTSTPTTTLRRFRCGRPSNRSRRWLPSYGNRFRMSERTVTATSSRWRSMVHATPSTYSRMSCCGGWTTSWIWYRMRRVYPMSCVSCCATCTPRSRAPTKSPPSMTSRTACARRFSSWRTSRRYCASTAMMVRCCGRIPACWDAWMHHSNCAATLRSSMQSTMIVIDSRSCTGRSRIQPCTSVICWCTTRPRRNVWTYSCWIPWRVTCNKSPHRVVPIPSTFNHSTLIGLLTITWSSSSTRMEVLYCSTI